jgi:hypothetical protein
MTWGSRVTGQAVDARWRMTEPHHVQAVTHRRIIEQDKRTGRKTLEVCHRACTKFLFITVAFDTHLRVEEDPVNRTVSGTGCFCMHQSQA